MFWKHTIVSTDAGENRHQILVVSEAVQGLLQSDGSVLDAGKEETEQTRLRQDDHQKLGQHLHSDNAVETAVSNRKDLFIIFDGSLFLGEELDGIIKIFFFWTTPHTEPPCFLRASSSYLIKLSIHRPPVS